MLPAARFAEAARANRSASTPLPITVVVMPQPASSSRATAADTHTCAYGSTIARSGQPSTSARRTCPTARCWCSGPGSQARRLYGRLTGPDPAIDGGTLRFAPDLGRNLDRADEVAESIKDTIDEHICSRGISAPTERRYSPVWEPPADPEALRLADAALGAVIWCTGYRTDFGWVDLPVFTGSGYPSHERGVSTVPGLQFLGLSWLHTWGSGRLSGVGRDAEHLADRIGSTR